MLTNLKKRRHFDRKKTCRYFLAVYVFKKKYQQKETSLLLGEKLPVAVAKKTSFKCSVLNREVEKYALLKKKK